MSAPRDKRVAQQTPVFPLGEEMRLVELDIQWVFERRAQRPDGTLGGWRELGFLMRGSAAATAALRRLVVTWGGDAEAQAAAARIELDPVTRQVVMLEVSA